MTSRSTAVLVVLAVTVAVTAAVPLHVGAIPAPPDDDSLDGQTQIGQADNQIGGDGNDTAVEQAGEGSASFRVASVSAPDSVAPGEATTVVALVENPNATMSVQPVELRIGGDVVDRRHAAVAGNEIEPVELELDASGLDAGEYLLSVFTDGDGVTTELTLSESFTVSELSAPETATAGENVTVAATVTNPNDVEATQHVTARFGGVPLVSERLTLAAGESTEFTAEADMTDVTPGSYAHGVLTRDAGQIARIDVEPSPTAEVTFEDQESDGTTVTVDSVTVPDGGYVAVHDESLLDGDAVGSVVGTSAYLDPGTHENVTVELFDVPGAEFDDETLTENATLIAMPHRETVGDRTYDFVRTDGEQDGPSLADGDPVTDEASVGVNATAAGPDSSVSVSISDQVSDGTTVTVDSVTVGEGGFLTLHDASRFEADVVESVVGTSAYLDPGTQENVTVELAENTTLTENTTLIVIPHRDTNGNEAADYVSSDGGEDDPYFVDGRPVIAVTNVTVQTADSTPASGTDGAEATPTATPEQ